LRFSVKTKESLVRIRVLSDLHEEYAANLGALEFDALPVDVTILAGDIANGLQAIEVASRPAFSESQVILVPGNHEFYGGQIDQVLVQMRAAAALTPNVHLLDGNTLVLNGVRFLGATLWTDYALDGVNRIQTAMQAALPRMNDYRLIQGNNGGPFSALESVALHHQARQWLSRALHESSANKTVVITHHAPHPFSVHSRFASNPVNPAFVSDLTELMGLAQLWVHGHTHNGFDYVVAGTRVVANPAGYRRAKRLSEEVGERKSAPATHEYWRFENTCFNPNFVCDV
jgi:Icc-related predicted phosphoesterase